MRIAYFIIVLCIHATSFAQKQPVLQFQQSLNGLSEVVTTKGSNSLLLKNNDSYTLLDQHSKIQLGSIFLDLESTGLPGLGKTMLLNDSVFLISTGRCLLSADLLNNQVDTFFNDIQFPEFIINYIQIPENPTSFCWPLKYIPWIRTDMCKQKRPGLVTDEFLMMVKIAGYYCLTAG